jgi:catechol 2,3-dioxygenase-like lactoylglutathione lyase family enzyme
MVLEPPHEVHLQEVGQIAFTVRNLAEAKSFYRDVLELKFLFEAGTMAFFQCGSVRLMIGEAEKPSISEGTIVYSALPTLKTRLTCWNHVESALFNSRI